MNKEFWDKFFNPENKSTLSEFHREKLIELYETQLEDSGYFMRVVLEEALRKLKETKLPPARIEKWVVKLEKAYNNS